MLHLAMTMSLGIIKCFRILWFMLPSVSASEINLCLIFIMTWLTRMPVFYLFSLLLDYLNYRTYDLSNVLKNRQAISIKVAVTSKTFSVILFSWVLLHCRSSCSLYFSLCNICFQWNNKPYKQTKNVLVHV